LTPAEAEIVRILLRATWPAPTAKQRGQRRRIPRSRMRR
jgi:hypothetical protein